MRISVFRKDPKNVGDWWSVPSRYFQVSGDGTYDLVDAKTIPNLAGVVVLGGGGLGRPDFQDFLSELLRPDRKYKVIGWGIGADSITRRREVLKGPADMQQLLEYFSELDEIGTRIAPENVSYPDKRFSWVPCASCMSPLFDEFSSSPIRQRVGVYEHLREPLTPHIGGPGRFLSRFFGPYSYLSNRGTDFRKKLAFLAQSEFIITNSYHGVYWGTLLKRKVVCVPFKNGLFSFKHAPAYLDIGGFESAMDRATT